MVNVLYDFVDLTPCCEPYIGAGVGYQWATESCSAPGRAGRGWPADRPEFQGCIRLPGHRRCGFSGFCPGLAFTLEYRFMGLTGNRNYGAGSHSGGAITSANV